MRIGIVISRIGGVDGVALETEKWIDVLKRLGHEVFIVTGALEREMPHVTIVPELYFFHPLTMREQRHAFFRCNHFGSRTAWLAKMPSHASADPRIQP